MTAFPLSGSLDQIVRLWSTLLLRLEIPSNIRAFEWSGEIAATSEIVVTHSLNLVPSRFLLLDAQGSSQIIRGVRKWDIQHVSFNNYGAAKFIGKILILP